MNKHHAPAVVYPLGRSRLLALIFLGFWLVGLALTCWWLQASQTIGLPHLAGFSASLLAGLVGFAAIKHSPTGALAWDGQNWRYESASYQAGTAEYEVMVVADFQHALLLRVKNKAYARLWLWAERSALPSRWLDLRRAVYSPHRAPTGQVVL